MRKHTRSALFLLLFILSLTGLIALVVKLPPTFMLQIATIQLPILPLFFILVFLTTFSLIAFILKNNIHGLIGGVLIIVLLLLRFFGLDHPLFMLLAIAAAVMIELFFAYRK